MADEPQTAEPAPAVPPAESPGHAEQTPSNATLAEWIRGLDAKLDRLLGGEGHPETPEAPDIKGEVRDAIRAVQAADKDKAAKETEALSIQDQIAQLKAEVERKPEEFRRVTQRMGWNQP